MVALINSTLDKRIRFFKNMRRTKIIATLGPASNTKETIQALFEAGANLFRLNFSHGTHDDHAKTAAIIREIEAQSNRPIGIIADLQGPKLRIGVFKDGSIVLEKGQSFRFDLDDAPGDNTRVQLPHPEVLGVLEEGKRIFLDDGKVRALIKKKGKDFVETEILSGAKLSDKKGLNVPDTHIPIPALTEKDKKDLEAALGMGADWIAQSFVQTPDDVKEARALIKDRAALMVKLEKPSALQYLDEIIDLTDGVMLARGDLGVEIPPEKVPSVQKMVVRHVKDSGKPIVVATQMLESMITNARPTRAEASDVATAVYDGADCVMLSAETASGEFPLRAVELMSRICKSTEDDDIYIDMMEIARPHALIDDTSDAITSAAYYVSQDTHAKLIVTFTASGATAQRMARQRPEIPILCLTPVKNVARRLTLSYGVYPVHDEEMMEDFAGPATHAANLAKKHKLAQKGDRFIMTAGVPFGTKGSTNILRIAEID